MPLFLSLAAAVSISVASLFSGTPKEDHRPSLDTKQIAHVQASTEGSSIDQEKKEVKTDEDIKEKSLAVKSNVESSVVDINESDEMFLQLSMIGQLQTVFDAEINTDADTQINMRSNTFSTTSRGEGAIKL